MKVLQFDSSRVKPSTISGDAQVLAPVQFRDIGELRERVVEIVVDTVDEMELPTADVIEDAIESVCEDNHDIRRKLWGEETLHAIEDALFAQF